MRWSHQGGVGHEFHGFTRESISEGIGTQVEKSRRATDDSALPQRSQQELMSSPQNCDCSEAGVVSLLVSWSNDAKLLTCCFLVDLILRVPLWFSTSHWSEVHFGPTKNLAIHLHLGLLNLNSYPCEAVQKWSTPKSSGFIMVDHHFPNRESHLYPFIIVIQDSPSPIQDIQDIPIFLYIPVLSCCIVDEFEPAQSQSDPLKLPCRQSMCVETNIRSVFLAWPLIDSTPSYLPNILEINFQHTRTSRKWRLWCKTTSRRARWRANVASDARHQTIAVLFFCFVASQWNGCWFIGTMNIHWHPDKHASTNWY